MGCCTLRILWRTIAVFTLILSFGIVVASIGALLVYHCVLNPDVSTLSWENEYLIYVVYFYNKECVKGNNSDYVVGQTGSSERTFGWAIAYLVVNTFWFFSSLLLATAPNYWKMSTGLWLTYPWLFVTFCVLCTDIASSVIFGLDYSHLQDLKELFKFIDLQYTTVPDISYIPLPTIIMIAFFSKVIIGWLLVFISFLTIFISLVKVGKPEELMLQTRAPIDYYAPASVNPAFQSEMTELERSTSPQRHSGSVHLDSPMYLADIPWDYQKQIQYTHHVIPRVPIRFDATESDDQQHMEHQQQRWPKNQLRQLSPDIDSRDWSYYQEQPISPKSILKTPQPQDNRYPYEGYSGQRPWSYLSHMQIPQRTQNEPSAPGSYPDNSSSMYY